MDRHVEKASVLPLPCEIVDVKRLVAEHGAPGGGFVNRYFSCSRSASACHATTADAEAADVAAQDKIPGGSELVTDARADQWIQPANAFCSQPSALN